MLGQSRVSFRGIDNLTLGQVAPIPEPSSVVMMAAGLLALRRATRGRSVAPQA
ncbi:PEP-CTERM sorting domain-containing protein [Paucibacter sp. TC2R-5]|uniref:PEP-CTERM sorting domain-containing protein n=1 Tax=Paucibacter sp. TC2R-5 TaxID=2893555 RepID=UPI0039E08A4F